MKKNFLVYLLAIILIPFVKAEDCGLLNLATCIPQKIYDFFLNIINAPIQPLLNLVKSLLTSPVNLVTFGSLWAIMIYILSLFYGFLMLYSGFNFMLSGYDAVKREKAKEWLRNTIIMIVLVQASFFIYSLFNDMSSLMTSGVIGLIDPNFFRLTADNIVNIGLEFFFSLFYVGVLLLTTLILTIRYLIVAAGVVLIPVGIFLYFIPPLKDYGRAIIGFLAICMFVTFLDGVILLVGSKLLVVSTFVDFKIIVMIASFVMANLIMLYFIFFNIFKAALSFGNRIMAPIVMVAKYFA